MLPQNRCQTICTAAGDGEGGVGEQWNVAFAFAFAECERRAGRGVRVRCGSAFAASGCVVCDDGDVERWLLCRQALCDYLLYCEHQPKKALELAAEAIKVTK